MASKFRAARRAATAQAEAEAGRAARRAVAIRHMEEGLSWARIRYGAALAALDEAAPEAEEQALVEALRAETAVRIREAELATFRAVG